MGSIIPYSESQLKWNGKRIVFTKIAAAGATLISGSTGSGKTTGIVNQMKQSIEDGESVIFAEFKGDPKVVDEIGSFARSKNFDVYTLAAGKSDFNYDPLLNLNNVGRIEALMNMRKWSLDGSDAHYKTSVQLLLQKLVGDFAHSYRGGSFTFEFLNYIKTYHPAGNEWDAYSTVSKILELLLTSILESMFKAQCGKTLNFKEIKNKRFLLIVSFVSSNKELATSFSSLMLRDLLDEFTVAPPNQNVNLYMDEFGTLENPFLIKDTLEKGRGGRIATTLSLLDLNQIIIQTNAAYLDSILGTINTFIIYSGATRVTAEKFAGVQLQSIEEVIMNLRKPMNGKPPTAIYISKYPSVNRRTNSEVFRFEPYYHNSGSFGSKSVSLKPSMKFGNFEKQADISEYKESEHSGETLNVNQTVDVNEIKIINEQNIEPKSVDSSKSDQANGSNSFYDFI